MARINLLPWRAERRRQRRTEFLAIVGICAGVVVLISAITHFYFQSCLDFQSERNQYLMAEIGKLDKQIHEIRELEREKARLVARMKAIQSLQTSRPIVVHLFDELVRAIPDGVYLKQLSQTNRIIEVKGVAESNARVSNFMRNIEKSEWLKNPKLEIIETTDAEKHRISSFTLKAEQVVPRANAQGEDDQT